MQIRFDGKTVIVAGAARGIGRAITRAFAADGGNVFACDKAGCGFEKPAGAIPALKEILLPATAAGKPAGAKKPPRRRAS